jgi:hypothetical protein
MDVLFGWKISVGVHDNFFPWKIAAVFNVDSKEGNSHTFNDVEISVMKLKNSFFSVLFE